MRLGDRLYLKDHQEDTGFPALEVALHTVFASEISDKFYFESNALSDALLLVGDEVFEACTRGVFNEEI